MRILHLLSQRPELTGSGVYVTRMIREAAAAGHENALLAGVPEDFSGAVDGCCAHHFVRFGRDLPHHVIGMSDVMPYPSVRFCDMTSKGVDAYEACFGHVLDLAVTEYQPDIIHSNHLWLLTSVAKRNFPHVPVVASCHGSDLRQFALNPHLRERVLEGCMQLDGVLALHRMQKQQIIHEYGIAPERVHVVGAGYADTVFRAGAGAPDAGSGDDPNADPGEGLTADAAESPKVCVGGIEASSAVRCGEGVGVTNCNTSDKSVAAYKCLRVAYAGKLADAKGVPWLLRAMKDVIVAAAAHGVSVTLDVCGSAPEKEREHLEPLFESLGDSVARHGNVTQDQLAAIFVSADVFVLPSFYEGLPLVLLEALACGCRLVATRLDGVEEVFGGMPESVIRLVNMPRLQGVDVPVAEDEAAFEKRLAEALLEQLLGDRYYLNMGSGRSGVCCADGGSGESGGKATVETIAQPAVKPTAEAFAGAALLKQYTWRAVYERVSGVYGTVMR